jgi:DNA polymerase (family 10)
MPNEALARIFYEIADLLELEGVRFKPEAYRRAARTLEQFPQEVKELEDPKELEKLPGIGEALQAKIEEFRRTGQVAYLARLRGQWPPGLLEIMRLEGVGPKTTRRFYQDLGISDPAGLERALEAGRLAGLPGFKERKLELLRAALREARAEVGGKGRLPLPEAQRVADELIQSLRKTGAPLDRLVYAGSLRRRREDVGDLDLLATSRDPAAVMQALRTLPGVREVKLSGTTKTTVVLERGLQVDLRVVPDDSFGAAWQYFTGSKDHNIHLRALAQQRGLKINEYGLSKGDRLTPTPTEEELYRAVGLAYMPPEVRENQGEIERAQTGSFPRLVERDDLRGELHIHIPASFGEEDALPWAEEARRQRLGYLGFVVREADLAASRTSVTALRERLPRTLGRVRLLLGVEGNGTVLAEGADFGVLRSPRAGPSESVEGCFLAHEEEGGPAGEGARSIPREVGADARRVLLPRAPLRSLVESGGVFVLSARPRLPEELGRLSLAAGVAARGWVPPEQVLNAREDPRAGPRSAGGEDPPAARSAGRRRG